VKGLNADKLKIEKLKFIKKNRTNKIEIDLKKKSIELTVAVLEKPEFAVSNCSHPP
jgi:hypothetical protein